MAESRYSSAEVKVGFFVTFCLALFVAMLASYGRMMPLWRGRQEILVAFDNVGSLRVDAPVRYNGVEVGRVRGMGILHLDDEGLAKLPPLTKLRLDNLPLRPEALKRDVRAAKDDDFENKCREALRDRSMILLTLEVLQEGDLKRYKLDDQVRIVTTMLGDTAVDIISGSGSVNLAGSKKALLGTSGDFFTNLAKSMGEVKDILSSVTDVVGTPERRSFERAQARFAPINKQLDEIAALATRRSDATMQRVDGLTTQVKTTMADLSAFPDKVRPQAQEATDHIQASFTALQDRFKETEAEFKAAAEEISNGVKPVRDDVKSAVDRAKPDFDAMRAKFRLVYDLLGGLSGKTEDARDTAGMAYSESEDDLARTMAALKNSLSNLDCTKQAANENKDLMISTHDVGEHEYATALDAYRQMTMATRRIREAGAQLMETALLAARHSPQDAPPVLPQATAANERLAAMRRPVDDVQRRVEDIMVPAFERKKTAWSEDAAAAK